MPSTRTTAGILIVGAGAAGATAAIDSATAGADVDVASFAPTIYGALREGAKPLYMSA